MGSEVHNGSAKDPPGAGKFRGVFTNEGSLLEIHGTGVIVFEGLYCGFLIMKLPFFLVRQLNIQPTSYYLAQCENTTVEKQEHPGHNFVLCSRPQPKVWNAMKGGSRNLRHVL